MPLILLLRRALLSVAELGLVLADDIVSESGDAAARCVRACGLVLRAQIQRQQRRQLKGTNYGARTAAEHRDTDSEGQQTPVFTVLPECARSHPSTPTVQSAVHTHTHETSNQPTKTGLSTHAAEHSHHSHHQTEQKKRKTTPQKQTHTLAHTHNDQLTGIVFRSRKTNHRNSQGAPTPRQSHPSHFARETFAGELVSTDPVCKCECVL